MPVLTLTAVWVNLVATGAGVSAQSDDSRAREYVDAGEVRTYGEGRQRAVTSEGERGSFAFTLVDVTEDELTTLRDWKSQLVQVRDHRGRRFYGVYFGVSVAEPRVFQAANTYTAGISLQFTTYTEGA
jgi:hypothetical protein